MNRRTARDTGRGGQRVVRRQLSGERRGGPARRRSIAGDDSTGEVVGEHHLAAVGEDVVL